ncbi:hypothetical protein M413DRAFT_446794 [Hebeloma cylindrosporum]|uniref:Uncharacterized protein n=1 Tax=Hebeloma cylindrosporum TaxID=76867 RepID=A0A0C3C6M2_HEBCY|nr:hypothetical protein M413DRAFT_446794 [Hebeloma cylindrosporum h7]
MHASVNGTAIVESERESSTSRNEIEICSEPERFGRLECCRGFGCISSLKDFS